MIGTAPFGRTGHRSTRVIFGSAGLGRSSQDEADAVLELLLAHGVNHIDTAASYGDAELRLSPWMAQHRARFFLATKTGERAGDAARASLERSLKRLGVDHVDLVQLHNLVEEDEWATAFAPGGAVEALARAREEGLTRALGVTGHGLRIARMHARSLERFDFDSVLLPFNAALLSSPGYRVDVEQLIGDCVERQVAVQAIKAIARRRYPGPAVTGERRLSWYEPLTAVDPIGRAVRFVLARPELFLVSSSDWRVLPALLDASSEYAEGARDIGAPTATEIDADREEYGVRPLFDGAELDRI